MTDYLDRETDFDDPRIASAHDELSFWSSRFGHLLFDHLELEGGLSILDVGTGNGFPLIELAQVHGPSCRLVGIDPWGPAIGRAAEKLRIHGLPNVRVMRGDGAFLPFASEIFDLVVSNLGINNFDDPPAVLAECARVSRRGARIVLTTNVTGHMGELYGVFRQVLSELGDAAALERLAVQEGHRGNRRLFASMLEKAGFEVRRTMEESFSLRFVDGGALLRHSLTRFGFLDGWREVAGPRREKEIFKALEASLDRRVRSGEGLVMTVPMLYLEGRRR